jgi:hypothetical protein
MEINIPIFRAKKLDSDECVEGGYSDTLFLCMGDIQGHYISYKKINVVGREITLQESIDPTTISIHFPDMLDSKGNKIFASLQEDGKGGDIMQDDEHFGIAKYKDCQFVVEYEDCIDNIDNGNFEVIGIQQ